MKQLLQRIGSVFHGEEENLDAGTFPARRSRVWVEQGDLWGETRQAPAPEAKAKAAPRFDFSETEIVRPPPAATHVRSGGTVHAGHRHGTGAEKIARFLEVNQTVKGGRDSFAYRVVQSIRGASADYDLWKGPTSHVTFLLGG
jgi:hypothetical protein